MLEAPTGTTYVALFPDVIGMTLIEPGGHEKRRATDDPSTRPGPEYHGRLGAPLTKAVRRQSALADLGLARHPQLELATTRVKPTTTGDRERGDDDELGAVAGREHSPLRTSRERSSGLEAAAG
jgi:hypothetical protein